MTDPRPGPIVLFGSGETSPSGGRMFESLVQALAVRGRPRLVLLETPAGFEPNSALVAGRVAEFLQKRLGNYRPIVQVLPARRRGTAFSPDDPGLLEPMLQADLVFLGAGSPTYAVRQLWDSLAWQRALARHRLGAVLALASAAAIASSAHALPVYEIYKAGQDLHWRTGLNLLAMYGLDLTFVPHWNNAEGGADLDTSRCFMGRERFASLRTQLPPQTTVVGLDEHTVLSIDVAEGQAQVHGLGGVTIERDGQETRLDTGQTFPLAALGPFRASDPVERWVPPVVWEEAQAAARTPPAAPAAPPEVEELLAERQAARARKDWAASDRLRAQISELGWAVQDTPAGPRLEPRA